jgi:membrane-bound ClpP family serine protease
VIFSQNKTAFMPIVTIVIILIVVGVLLWLINAYIPMQSTIKTILNVVVVICVIVWLLQEFDLFNGMMNMHARN